MMMPDGNDILPGGSGRCGETIEVFPFTHALSDGTDALDIISEMNNSRSEKVFRFGVPQCAMP